MAIDGLVVMDRVSVGQAASFACKQCNDDLTIRILLQQFQICNRNHLRCSVAQDAPRWGPMQACGMSYAE